MLTLSETFTWFDLCQIADEFIVDAQTGRVVVTVWKLLGCAPECVICAVDTAEETATDTETRETELVEV